MVGWLEAFPVDPEFMGKHAQIGKLKNETLKLCKVFSVSNFTGFFKGFFGLLLELSG